MEDLVGYLTSKGLSVSRAAGYEVTIHCPWCPDGNPKGKGKCYLNTDSWLYDCKRCGTHGGKRSLMRHFGDEDNVAYTSGQDPHKRRVLLNEAAALAHEMLIANDKQLTYLLERGLSPETIVEHQLGYVPKNFSIARSLPLFEKGDAKIADLLNAGLITQGGNDYFNDELIIPYLSHGQAIQLRGKKIGGKYRTPMGDNVRLYNEDALRDAEDVIITEGEFDAMILGQHLKESGDARLRATAVVAIPGAKAFPDNFESMFDKAKRVFLGFDPDVEGRGAISRVRAILGTRVRVLDLPRALPKCDWTEFLMDKSPEHPHGGHTWHDLDQMLVEADLVGKRMFSITEVAAKWSFRDTEAPGIKLGWMSLDSILRPGLRPGQLMIPLAKTGTGKSVFLSNILHNTRQQRTLMLSLELQAEDVYEHLRRIHYFWNPASPREDMIEDYSKLRIVDKNRLTRSDLGALVAEYAEDVGAPPELMIIDYLGYYARGLRTTGAYERTSEAVMDIKEVAKEHGIGVIAPHQVNRGAEDGKPLDADDARDSGVIEETGDFVLGLFRPGQIKQDSGEVVEDTTGAFSIQLLKSRHGGKGRVFNLRFSQMSLAICDALDRPSSHRVQQENAAYMRGKHYDDYRNEMSATQLALVK